jgi:hypothetical protein
MGSLGRRRAVQTSRAPLSRPLKHSYFESSAIISLEIPPGLELVIKAKCPFCPDRATINGVVRRGE